MARAASKRKVGRIVRSAFRQRHDMVYLAAHAGRSPPLPIEPGAHPRAVGAPAPRPLDGLLPGLLVLGAAVVGAPRLPGLARAVALGRLPLRPRPARAAPSCWNDAAAVRAERSHPRHAASSLWRPGLGGTRAGGKVTPFRARRHGSTRLTFPAGDRPRSCRPPNRTRRTRGRGLKAARRRQGIRGPPPLR